ncbi:MAG: hypothetical protein D6791_11020 [Chloroflexi bacterium]|nr:MAG: hypothetical protein D6791_11020 [Chloroflexota bacterium]
MTSRKLLSLTALISLAILALLSIGLMIPLRVPMSHNDSPNDALFYATRGPHPVGVLALKKIGEAELEVTMWYPALDDGDSQAKITYAYEMKVGGPVGAFTLATFAGQALHDAPYDRTPGPYPLVILSPGFAIGSSAYAWLAEHLASYGFVVIAPEHQEQLDGELNGLWQGAILRPQEIQTVLAYIDEQASPGHMLEGLVDAETLAVIGHSYGGYTALAAGGARIDTVSFQALCQAAYKSNEPGAWLCDELLPHLPDMAALAGLDAVPDGLWQPTWLDSRVDAIVSMAGDAFFFGQQGLADITAPVMAIGGTLDTDAPYMWGTYPTYEYASSKTKVRIALLDAEHMIFTGPCESIPLLLRFVSDEFCADSGWNRDDAHALVRHFTAAFLLYTLKNDHLAHETLLPDAATQFTGIKYSTTLGKDDGP